MAHLIRNRSRLLVGCGSAALALALIIPQRAEAQAINATGNVTLGSVSIDESQPAQTRVSVFTRTAAIDWTPSEDNNGDALDFLPTNTTAIFESGDGVSDFAVLNRILPSTNGNVVVMDGAVISRIIDANGAPRPGGFVAFYSPTGILIGSNASFDVGQLLLTTLDTSPTNFQNFVENNGTLALAGTSGSTARIQINPGAQILATPENSFFAVVAADVQMLGSARINGSHAYVAGEVVNLQFSNGLFDIFLPVGTAAGGTVVEVDGTIGGPSSNGAGDNHMIYGVAVAQNDPISMIFRGNLGFDPAQSAGIVNGEIILSANYAVSGRNVAGGSISDGIDAVFAGNNELSDVRADIFLEDFASTSSILAIGTHTTQVSAFNSDASVDGNLLIVGRETADLNASNGRSFTVSGDVLVSAQDYGVVSSSLQNLDVINAQGGVAMIEAFGGGSISIGGDALVAADAFAGADDLNGIAGTAQGGQALIGSTGGTLAITGSAIVSARGVGANLQNLVTGAESRGGLAQVFARQGGQVTIGSDLDILADAIGAQGSLFSPSSVSDAFGGDAIITIFDGGGTIGIGGAAFLDASARGGDSNNAGPGSVGDAGQALVNIDGAGTITITGAALLRAAGSGGTNSGGTGGNGFGGRASATTFSGGTIDFGDRFEADAIGNGGNGQSGGDGFGGIAGANAVTGSIAIGASALAQALGDGGSANFGFGGNGGNGRGGNAFFQADGTLNATASVTIAGDASAFAGGSGGDGGQTDGQAFPAGRGGDGFGGDIAVPNQADPAFGSGAFILAGGDNGNVSVGGVALASATGRGGTGGFGGSIISGGPGGDGFGGLAQVGLALFGQDGSLGQGSATFGSLIAEAIGFGGSGGFSFDFPTGNGGGGTGGNALLTIRAGTVTADDITLEGSGFGGDGAVGGLGTGGIAAAFGSLGGSLTGNLFAARATGFGGFGSVDLSGNGQGGEAEFDFQGITVQIDGDVVVEANGFGGSSNTAADGIGGTARLGVLGATPGSGTVTGNTEVVANGFGGSADSGPGSVAGNGTGGTASVQAQGGSTVSLATLQVMASGFGGEGEISGYQAGNGTGGSAEIAALGSGSQVVIARNTTNAQVTQENFGAIISANGVGSIGTGGNGIGGSGGGGSITLRAALGGTILLPTDPLNDPDSVGAIRLLAQGFGGDSNVEGGTGGGAFGGQGAIEADGGTILMGETLYSVFAQGGSSFDPMGNISGGNAFGGRRRIRVLNGGDLTLQLVGGASGGVGGNGSGLGDGGDAVGGANIVEIVNATLNVVGNLDIGDQSTGGNGNNGGDVFASGEGGGLGFIATGATINFTPVNGEAGIFLGGLVQGGAGVVRGGDARGANVNVAISQTDLVGGRFQINPLALGGSASAIDGVGGNAFGSLTAIAIADSQIDLIGETLFAADARGGAGGTDGTGGSATSGSLRATISGSTLNFASDANGPGTLRLRSQANGGEAGTMGDATALLAELNLVDTTLNGDLIAIEATAFANAFSAGQTGATATGGDAALILSGTSEVIVDGIEIVSNAQTSTGGRALGGTSSLALADGGAADLTVTRIDLLADAFGADPLSQDNVAGQFSARVGGGTLSTQSLFASAGGSTNNPDLGPSELSAAGGSLLVANVLSAFAVDEIVIRTGGGGIIGGPRAVATTTVVDIFSGTGISIEGDNGAAVGLGGDSITLAAPDIDILSGARIGADVVRIISTDRLNTAVLGGTIQGSGFTLTGDEIGRIEGRELYFEMPNLFQSNDPNQPALLIRDMSIEGTGNQGFELVDIFVGSDLADGIARVEGTLSYVDAGTEDRLRITAGRLEVVTPGGIRIEGANNLPGGLLALRAGDIWVADADTIAQLQADRSFAGRDELLAAAATGSDDPLGYIRARGVEINVSQSLLVRNTGIPFEGGGILVGDGGLSIDFDASGQASAGVPLDVFAYGRRRAPDGSFVVGEAFFDEVNYNRVSPGSALYLDAAAFNDCIINTGECPQAPPPPETPTDIPPEINNPIVIVEPLGTGGEPPMAAGEDEERFGMDFPDQPEAPLISEDPLLDDPVTSGGDASLYSGEETGPDGGGDK